MTAKKTARKAPAKPQTPKLEVQKPDSTEPLLAPRTPTPVRDTRAARAAHVPRASNSRPTMGRIVRFQEHMSGGQILDHAAIINRVLADGLVELTVFTAVGPVVKSRVAFSENPLPGMWSWPELIL